MTVDFPSAQLDHVMVAIGWNTYNQGDLVYQGSGPEDPDIILDSYIPTDNWLVWLFKNSWGESLPYYRVSNFYDLILDQT